MPAGTTECQHPAARGLDPLADADILRHMLDTQIGAVMAVRPALGALAEAARLVAGAQDGARIGAGDVVIAVAASGRTPYPIAVAGAGRIQRRAEFEARWRLGGRSHHLPPFDASLARYEKGQIADPSNLAAMANFPDVAKSAWQTDDGAHTVCVPMARAIRGFIYNKDAFAELGLSVPATVDAFFATLDKIRADGTDIPLAMGPNDQWEAATMLAPFRQLARWKDYPGDGFQAQTYPDSQNLFTLGRAAIFPAGSWEISGFNAEAGFAMGAFPPPVAAAGEACCISDHTDIAIGLNAACAHAAGAKAFLDWVGSPESPHAMPVRFRASSR